MLNLMLEIQAAEPISELFKDMKLNKEYPKDMLEKLKPRSSARFRSACNLIACSTEFIEWLIQPAE